MPKELIALAGDLVAERKRLSEALRRLEGAIAPDQVTNALFKALGAGTAEAMLSEVDNLARSMDRLGALVKTLVQQAYNERLEPCEPLLADAALTIEAKASMLERPVVIDCKSNDVKIDRDILNRLRPIFLEMLETLVEFCVESPKERFARKKRPKSCFQLDVKPSEAGYRITVLCDGNGILPPMASDHGLMLAEIGCRASFEGKPGQWSAWRFHVPTGIGAFQGLPVRLGPRRLVIPQWSVTSIRKADPARIPPGALTLAEGLTRLEASARVAPGTMLVEVAAGTQSGTYLFDEVYPPEEGFMKQLSEAFSGQGRFLGVVVSEVRESHGPRVETREELCLVLNPAYLVYGGHEDHAPGATTEASAGAPPEAAKPLGGHRAS